LVAAVLPFGGKATASEDEEYAELHHPLPAAN